MIDDVPAAPVLRFAPSPNGALHLGHAYSALMNERVAAELGGRLLLRIEDLDRTRCKPQFEAAIVENLAWLGLVFPEPPRRQSEHGDDYAAALARLDEKDMVYPCFCSRAEVSRASAGERDPDGAPLYPGTCRLLGKAESQARLARGDPAALRRRVFIGRNMARASFPRSIRRRRKFGATLSSGAAISRRAIIWRLWWTTRCRA
jgi:glutamyl-Q tRNA(Asp) synthetase